MRADRMRSMRIPRRIRLSILAVVAAGLVLGRMVESRRISAALPRDARVLTVPRLDSEQMMLDLQILASDRFKGRATDTEGGALAAQMIATRFGELGLAKFAGHFEQPFSFVHRSIRALWRRNRPFTMQFLAARNVVGYVEGTRAPSEFIVVSAHFDHLGEIDGRIYHGADDNASGTAAMLAIAKYVTANPLAHSVVFAAFDAEELGLRGSEAFVAALPFARDHLLLDINIDMIGRGDAGRLFVAGVQHSPELRPVVEAAARGATVPVYLGHDRPLYLTGLIDDWTSSSDHSSFHDAGVPFLYFGVEDHADLHQPTDTADRIAPAFLAGAAETVLATLLQADRR